MDLDTHAREKIRDVASLSILFAKIILAQIFAQSFAQIVLADRPAVAINSTKAGTVQASSNKIDRSKRSKPIEHGERWIGVYAWKSGSELVKKIAITRRADGRLSMRISLLGMPDETAEYDGVAEPYNALGKNGKLSLIARFNIGKFQPVMILTDKKAQTVQTSATHISDVDRKPVSIITFNYSMRDIDGSAMHVVGTVERVTAN